MSQATPAALTKCRGLGVLWTEMSFTVLGPGESTVGCQQTVTGGLLPPSETAVPSHGGGQGALRSLTTRANREKYRHSCPWAPPPCSPPTDGFNNESGVEGDIQSAAVHITSLLTRNMYNLRDSESCPHLIDTIGVSLPLLRKNFPRASFSTFHLYVILEARCTKVEHGCSP